MNGVFRTVSKRRNSTKTGTGGTSVGLILKDGCSIIAPRLALKWDGLTAPTAWNHVFIEDWDRTYWVDNWTYEDRQWVADCSVDVLASYKTTIGNAEKYILRAADDYDPHIIDRKYPPIMPPSIVSSVLVGIAWATTFDYGRFVVGIVGQGNTFQAAGSGFVVLTSAQLQQLLSACFTETVNIWSSQTSLGSDVGESLARFGENYMKSVQNPLQFINSVFWVPFVPTTNGTTTIRLGAVNTGISAATLSDPVHTTNFSCTFDTAENGTDDWQNIEPFVHYTLHCPPFPDLELPAAKIVGGTGISGVIYTDVTCGLSHMEVYGAGGSGKAIATASAIVGVAVNLSGSSVDYAGVIKGAVGAAGGIVASALTGNVVGAITGAVSGIAGVAEAAQPQATNGGYSGGLAALKAAKHLVRATYDYPDIDNDEQGKPLMELDYIMNHSGYLLCADGDIEIAGTPGEAAQIAAYLTGGFFYE